MSKFKKGDKVRIIGDDAMHELPIGSIQTITESFNAGVYLEGTEMFARYEDIELVSEEKKTTLPLTAKELMNEGPLAVSYDELYYHIGDSILLDEYKKIEGVTCSDKVQNLKNHWKSKEKKTKFGYGENDVIKFKTDEEARKLFEICGFDDIHLYFDGSNDYIRMTDGDGNHWDVTDPSLNNNIIPAADFIKEHGGEGSFYTKTELASLNLDFSSPIGYYNDNPPKEIRDKYLHQKEMYEYTIDKYREGLKLKMPDTSLYDHTRIARLGNGILSQIKTNNLHNLTCKPKKKQLDLSNKEVKKHKLNTNK